MKIIRIKECNGSTGYPICTYRKHELEALENDRIGQMVPYCIHPKWENIRRIESPGQEQEWCPLEDES